MTYLYMTRDDGEWARYDFEDILESDEDIWVYLERASPELWEALPINAEFVIGEDGNGFHPGRFETFGNMDDLVEWACDGKVM